MAYKPIALDHVNIFVRDDQPVPTGVNDIDTTADRIPVAQSVGRRCRAVRSVGCGWPTLRRGGCAARSSGLRWHATPRVFRGGRTACVCREWPAACLGNRGWRTACSACLGNCGWHTVCLYRGCPATGYVGGGWGVVCRGWRTACVCRGWFATSDVSDGGNTASRGWHTVCVCRGWPVASDVGGGWHAACRGWCPACVRCGRRAGRFVVRR